MRKITSLFFKAIGWWASTLVGILPPVVRQALSQLLVQEGTRCVVGFEDDRVSFHMSSPGGLLPVGTAAPDDRAEIARLLRQAKCARNEVILALPSDRVMTRTLSYPFKAEPDLSSALEFSVERLTPVRANEARWDWRILARDQRSKTLTVSLCVVPTWIVDEALNKTSAIGLSADRIDVIAESGKDLIGVDLARSLKSFRMPRPTAVTTFGMVFLLVTIAGAAHISVAQSVAAQQASAEAMELREAATPVNLAQKELQVVQDQLDMLADVQDSIVPASVILNELARILPDGTWLFEFNTRGREISISGESNEASRLLGLIDGSAMFENARFASALTQGTGDKAERFVVTFDYTTERAT